MDKQRVLKETAEQAKITDAAPTRKQLAEALGPFKTCSVPTYVEEADGSSQVNITSEKADAAENRRRWAMHVEALAGKRALETDRSEQRSADQDVVIVHDERTGDTRPVPAEREDAVARKPWARASRGRKFFFMGGG